MIKKGICTIEQLKTSNLKGIWGDDKFVAADLYIEALNNSEYEHLQESILMSMQDRRGAYKRTYKNRFNEFDKKVEEILGSHLSDIENANILDVGISDGRTSLDFFSLLKPYLPKDYSYYATDYSPYIKVIRKGNTRIILDGWDNIIQIVKPPFVLNTSVSKNICLYPINIISLFILKTFVAKPTVRQYKLSNLKSENVLLFNGDLQNLAKNNTSINLDQYSVLEPLKFNKTFNVIRAMNLFNESYFSDKEFEVAFNNIKQGVTENGYIIIGSNNDADTVVNGAIYKNTESGFKEVYTSGKGVPIKKIKTYMG